MLNYLCLKKLSNITLKLYKLQFKNQIHLTHVGPQKMVNVGDKPTTKRFAKASCSVFTTKEVVILISENKNVKGDVLRTAEIAGIMAAKKTSELIPLCHQLNLTTVNIKILLPDLNELECNYNKAEIKLESYVQTNAQTGVEMEAMTALTIAALTIYDMCKAADKRIEISQIKLIEKYGGKSGHFKI